MPKVVRKDIDNLNAELTVTIEKADVESTLTPKLNDVRKKAQLKGFRKGKTPMGFIKKMYGQSLLVETVNESLQKGLMDYLKDEEINILGQPIPAAEQTTLNFDINNLGDYTFVFDIGISPAFELTGVDDKTKIDRNAVKVSDKLIQEDLDHALKQAGAPVPTDEAIDTKDMVTMDIEELEDGKVKAKGWAATFDVLVDTQLEDTFKEKIVGKKKGHKFQLNIQQVEKDRTMEHIRKYFLRVEEVDADVEIGDEFNAVIKEVKRVKPAEMDQAFFDKYFPEGDVKDEAGAKKAFEKNITKYYDQQADALLFKAMQDNLIEQNKFDLPEAFLKRWLKETNEDVTEEIIEKEFDAFSKNLRWSLIKGEIVKKYDIQINDEAVFEGFKNRVRSYFGGQQVDELIVLNTANRLMEDKEQVNQLYQELVADQVFEKAKETMTIVDKKISSEDFDEVILKARQEAGQIPQSVDAPEVIEEAEVIEEVTED